MSMRFTVVGANGMIGRALYESLHIQGHDVLSWTREARPPRNVPLGHVFFAAGVTADFRARPLATAQTHVSLLAELMSDYQFDSLMYFSAARMYRHAEHTREDAQFIMNPTDPEQLYDFTKLCAESLCLQISQPNVRVMRLSNVVSVDPYGVTFLPSILRDALQSGHVTLRQHPDSCKDYVMLEDIVQLLPRIAQEGKAQIYNIASGRAVRAGDILHVIAARTGCTVTIDPSLAAIMQPSIDITRVSSEFNFTPANFMEKLEDVIDATAAAYRRNDQH